jgi:hypothetical protein
MVIDLFKAVTSISSGYRVFRNHIPCATERPSLHSAIVHRRDIQGHTHRGTVGGLVDVVCGGF